MAKVYALKPGSMWNPMLNGPRNAPCPCGSGKKFKKCHLPMMPIAVKIADVDGAAKAAIAEHAKRKAGAK